MPVFRLHNTYCVFSTCTNKFKWLLYTEKHEFNEFKISNPNRFGSKKTINTYLKTVNKSYKCPITPHNINLFELDFNIKFPLLRLLKEISSFTISK